MLLLYGFETVASDWHVEENNAPLYCRVYYIISGDVMYHCGSTHKRLKHEHLYIFPSTVPYCMEQNPADPLTCLFLHLDIFPHLLTDLLEIRIEEDSFLYHLLRSMQLQMPEKGCQGYHSILSPLSDAFIGDCLNRNLFQSVPAALTQAIRYIADHVSEKISIKTLSLLCGYHPQYFIRLFQKHMKMTPHQYIISYRMRLSLYALLAGNTAAETALKVGYSEARNFTRAFQKHYGFSPSQIRKFLYYN